MLSEYDALDRSIRSGRRVREKYVNPTLRTGLCTPIHCEHFVNEKKRPYIARLIFVRRHQHRGDDEAREEKTRDRDTDTETDAGKWELKGSGERYLACRQAGRQGGVEDMRVGQVGEDILSDTQITAR